MYLSKLIEVIFTHSEPNHNFITEIQAKASKDLKCSFFKKQTSFVATNGTFFVYA